MPLLHATPTNSKYRDVEAARLTTMQVPAARRANRLFAAILLCATGWYIWSAHIVVGPRPFSRPKEMTLQEMDFSSLNSTNHLPLIPAKIWQIYLSFTHDSVPTDFLETWIRNSPSYLYGILDANGAQSLVEKVSHQPKYSNVLDSYYAMTRRVLRADFLRYLLLAMEGGLYSDIDTRLLKPMYDWVPEPYRENTKLIVGLESDTDPPVRGTFYQVQFCQWTLASAPDHPALWKMTDRIIEKMNSRPDKEAEFSDEDVLSITGPAGWTEIVFAHISKEMGEEITWKNLTGMREPRLFGDTLVLPIDGFATGVPHSGASREIGPGSMVWHHFANGWKEGRG